MREIATGVNAWTREQMIDLAVRALASPSDTPAQPQEERTE